MPKIEDERLKKLFGGDIFSIRAIDKVPWPWACQCSAFAECHSAEQNLAVVIQLLVIQSWSLLKRYDIRKLFHTFKTLF